MKTEVLVDLCRSPSSPLHISQEIYQGVCTKLLSPAKTLDLPVIIQSTPHYLCSPCQFVIVALRLYGGGGEGVGFGGLECSLQLTGWRCP